MKDKGFKITCTDETTECNGEPELSSNQQEADTKVFLAAKFAQDIGCRDVGIFTVNSDVAILACYYSELINCRLLLQVGSGSNLRILDIGNNDLEEDLLKSLPSLHALSGCDSVSAINGIGKGKWLKTVTKSDKYIFAIQVLGEDIAVDKSTTNVIEKLFCHLYGMPEENEINDLPPTKDQLLQHVKRANYQSFIWKRALHGNPDITSPVGNGWSLSGDVLEVVWMESLPAPESVLGLKTCDCRRLKCNASCQCKILSLECTDICKCHTNCENVSYNDDSDTDDEEIEESIFMNTTLIYSIYLRNLYLHVLLNISIISREMLHNTSNFVEMIPAILKFECNCDSYDTNR